MAASSQNSACVMTVCWRWGIGPGYDLTMSGSDGSRVPDRYRLINTLLAHHCFPAAALPRHYHERWGIESPHPRPAAPRIAAYACAGRRTSTELGALTRGVGLPQDGIPANW